MQEPVPIKNNHDERTGAISFNTNPDYLRAYRTTAGFTIQIPIEVQLRLVRRDDPTPLLTHLRGVLIAKDPLGTPIEIGQLRDESWYSTGWSENPTEYSKNSAFMTWSGALAELALYEKIREGRPPIFQIQLYGELCYLLKTDNLRYSIRTNPQNFYGSTEFSYPTEIWVAKLQELGVLENVLVEVPLPSSPPAPWDGVWENLVAARKHFERGGLTGWSACILSVRQALEKWRDIEGTITGPADPMKRSKRERLNNLRLALHQCTHIWIHKDEEASRNDALLMLSTLSALLAERKP